MSKTYAAKRLPKHAGLAGWNEILGARIPFAPLSENVEADFVIVGAGFAGLTAARRLVQLNPDARIVVLEAGQVGQGAAGRNSGFMIDLPHNLTSDDYTGDSAQADRDQTRLNRLAIEYARDMVVEFGIDPGYYCPDGKINAARSNASHEKNVRYARHLEKLGERFELLDEQGMAELTGTRYYRSGLFTPGTVMIQPAGYVRGIAAGLGKSVRLCENTPALGFSESAGCWLVRTPKAEVRAKKVILCNNGQLESFGIKRHRLMHIFLFACMTEELDAAALARLGGRPRWGVTPTDPMGTTMRRIETAQGGHRIITRTCAEFCPDMETTDRQMRRASAIMRKRFDDRFPQLAGMPMAYTWSGHLCLSRNGVSVAGQIDDGVYSACCQNGLGAARGTLTGINAAEMASGFSSTITDYFQREKSPTLVPPAPFSTLGATAVLRVNEWRARTE